MPPTDETMGVFPNNSYNIFQETVDPNLKVANLLTQEEARLTSKKKAIDPLYNTKQRHDAQLRSTTLRKNAYNYIIFVVVAAVSVVMALFIVKNNFPLLPEWFMNFLLVFTIGGCIIYILILYADVLKRDTADFEKVDFGLLMEVDAVKQKNKNDGGAGVVLGVEEGTASVNCVGSKCCPAQSYFWGNKCNRTIETFSSRMPTFTSYAPMPSFASV